MSYSAQKFENALDFLDQVKRVFRLKPGVYNRFLDIMKEFKAHIIDTPGVISRVKQLFRGHHDLILGFNTFVPPGFEIKEEDIESEEQENLEAKSKTGEDSSTSTRGRRKASTRSANSKVSQQHSKPEFDHARNYVRKIKVRFVAEPYVYRTFLEILHAYHRKQQTIQMVYIKVADLFADHQDLLDEFTQFLPDPNVRMPKSGGRDRGNSHLMMDGENIGEVIEPRKTRRTRRSGRASTKRVASVREARESPERSSHHPFSRMEPLLRIKIFLDQESWDEFLKCMELLNMQVIGKLEFLMLVRDLLGTSKESYEHFDRLREYIGVTEEEFNEEDVGIGDLDLSNCERSGTSYRKCLDTFRFKPCSGTTDLAKSVLNNEWISRPTGEESGVFKSSRKNEWEEKLFRCEDERFEFDLFVERNNSAIRALERLQQRISNLSFEERSNYKVQTDDLSQLHELAIKQLYGSRGQEVLALLNEHPAATIPVIIDRLKVRHSEWLENKSHWLEQWRQVQQENYERALDHEGYFFKVEQKQNLDPKTIVQEANTRYQERRQQQRPPPTPPFQSPPPPPSESSSQPNENTNEENITNDSGDAGGTRSLDTVMKDEDFTSTDNAPPSQPPSSGKGPSDGSVSAVDPSANGEQNQDMEVDSVPVDSREKSPPLPLQNGKVEGEGKAKAQPHSTPTSPAYHHDQYSTLNPPSKGSSLTVELLLQEQGLLPTRRALRPIYRLDHHGHHDERGSASHPLTSSMVLPSTPFSPSYGERLRRKERQRLSESGTFTSLLSPPRSSRTQERGRGRGGGGRRGRGASSHRTILGPQEKEDEVMFDMELELEEGEGAAFEQPEDYGYYNNADDRKLRNAFYHYYYDGYEHREEKQTCDFENYFPDESLHQDVLKLLQLVGEKYLEKPEREKFRNLFVPFIESFFMASTTPMSNSSTSSSTSLQVSGTHPTCKPVRLHSSETPLTTIKPSSNISVPISSPSPTPVPDPTYTSSSPATSTPTNPIPSIPPRSIRVLFANSAMVVFCRYLQILYSRLLLAKRLAENPYTLTYFQPHALEPTPRVSLAPTTMTVPNKSSAVSGVGRSYACGMDLSPEALLTSHRQTEGVSLVDFSSLDEMKENHLSNEEKKLGGDSVLVSPQDATVATSAVSTGKDNVLTTREQRYRVWLASVGEVVRNNISQDQYEAMVSSVLGIHSYRLFMMDRLASYLGKQMCKVLSNMLSLRLLGLYLYDQHFTDNESNQPSLKRYLENVLSLFVNKRWYCLELTHTHPHAPHFTITQLPTLTNITLCSPLPTPPSTQEVKELLAARQMERVQNKEVTTSSNPAKTEDATATMEMVEEESGEEGERKGRKRVSEEEEGEREELGVEKKKGRSTSPSPSLPSTPVEKDPPLPPYKQVVSVPSHHHAWDLFMRGVVEGDIEDEEGERTNGEEDGVEIEEYEEVRESESASASISESESETESEREVESDNERIAHTGLRTRSRSRGKGSQNSQENGEDGEKGATNTNEVNEEKEMPIGTRLTRRRKRVNYNNRNSNADSTNTQGNSSFLSPPGAVKSSKKSRVMTTLREKNNTSNPASRTIETTPALGSGKFLDPLLKRVEGEGETVYLSRNVDSTLVNMRHSLAQVHHNTLQRNALTSHLNPHTYHPKYVSHTDDIFWRNRYPTDTCNEGKSIREKVGAPTPSPSVEMVTARLALRMSEGLNNNTYAARVSSEAIATVVAEESNPAGVPPSSSPTFPETADGNME